MNFETPWLLLFHQLPSGTPYLRVKTWRSLREAGAVVVRNAVYVLPATPGCSEAFARIRREIDHGGGHCVVARAQFIDGMSDGQMRALFNQARNGDYLVLEKELRKLVQARRRKGARDDDIRGRLEKIGQRLAHVHGLDFFGASGRPAAEALLSRLEHGPIAVGGSGPARHAPVRDRTWVTRRNIHVDRIASAWLIRRFIDPGAAFKFTARKQYRPLAGELRFDMAGAEYTHEGDKCSFEVLLERLGPLDAALQGIAQIIHDLDIRDGRFRRPETGDVAAAIDDICRTQPDDMVRIGRGSVLFDALHARLRA